MTEPFLCSRCGAPLTLPTDESVLDVECPFCQTKTPTPKARLDQLRRQGAPAAGASKGAPIFLLVASLVVAGGVGAFFLTAKKPAPPPVPATVKVAAATATPRAATKKPDPGPTIAKLVASFGSEGTGPLLFKDGSLASDVDGNLYVYTNDAIQQIDPSGKFVKMIAIPDTGSVNNRPWSIACDLTGGIYVSRGHQILELSTKDGSLLHTFKEKARVGKKAQKDEFCPRRITTDTMNDVFAINDCAPEGISIGYDDFFSISKFDPKGKPAGHYTGIDDGYIAVDGTGTIFVAVDLTNEIRVFDKDGKFANKWGRRGDDPGEFSGSFQGLAVDGHGHLFVADFRGIGVYDGDGKYRGRFAKDGRAITVTPKGDVYTLTSKNVIERYQMTL
jgi:sugar lactone lactonase YvrE